MMPGKVMKIGSFSDWEGLFKEWREEIGVNHNDIRNFKFDTLYGAIETEEISFGYYKGRNCGRTFARFLRRTCATR